MVPQPRGELLDQLSEHLPQWLAQQPWFIGKDRPVQAVQVVNATPLLTDEPHLDLVVLAVEFSDGRAAERYHLLVGRRPVAPSDLEYGVIGPVGGTIAYDGVWDHQVTNWLLRALANGEYHNGVRFLPEPGPDLPTGLTGRVLTIEGHNTSIAYGEELILTLFRRVVAGINPDLELHRALRGVGSEHVARLRAAIEYTLNGDQSSVGMLQDFAANSADGWTMAQVSLRDLFAEGDLHPEEVGGDFAGEAYRLGEAVAAVHAELATALGSATLDSAGLAAMAEGMIQRWNDALPVVPEMAGLAERAHSAFTAVRHLPPGLPVQRVHGDLHLGQVLRTPTRWLLTNFGGEPGTPLAQRRAADSPLRDVAAMLHSFDVAARYQLLEWEQHPASHNFQLEHRAEEWALHNRNAFCDGYAAAAGADPRDDAVLLHAYELERAMMGDSEHRPHWATIQLWSLRQLTEGRLGRQRG